MRRINPLVNFWGVIIITIIVIITIIIMIGLGNFCILWQGWVSALPRSAQKSVFYFRIFRHVSVSSTYHPGTSVRSAYFQSSILSTIQHL